MRLDQRMLSLSNSLGDKLDIEQSEVIGVSSLNNLFQLSQIFRGIILLHCVTLSAVREFLSEVENSPSELVILSGLSWVEGTQRTAAQEAKTL